VPCHASKETYPSFLGLQQLYKSHFGLPSPAPSSFAEARKPTEAARVEALLLSTFKYFYKPARFGEDPILTPFSAPTPSIFAAHTLVSERRKRTPLGPKTRLAQPTCCPSLSRRRILPSRMPAGE
jgi:hypothetical protein